MFAGSRPCGVASGAGAGADEQPRKADEGGGQHSSRHAGSTDEQGGPAIKTSAHKGTRFAAQRVCLLVRLVTPFITAIALFACC